MVPYPAVNYAVLIAAKLSLVEGPAGVVGHHAVSRARCHALLQRCRQLREPVVSARTRQIRAPGVGIVAEVARKVSASHWAVIHDGRVDDEALTGMQEAAALWSVGQVTAAELVDAACELLVAGFDGLNLAVLAGVHVRCADEEVPELLEDVGLQYYQRGS